MGILITGGSGRLGTAIQKRINCVAPSHEELDILNKQSCQDVVQHYCPDIIIHCAAYTNSVRAEQNKDACFNLNVVGTKNMLLASPHGCRFVYMSSDYVFDGKRGRYKVGDKPNPINYYGLTKYLGEIETQYFANTLVIRTGFKNLPFEHDKAFVDQWTSGVFIEERAKDIVDLVLSGETGLVHIGGKRRTVYEMVKTVKPSIGKISIKDMVIRIPRDVSLV